MSTKLGKHCIGKSYAGLHRNNFIKERLQHRCFPVNNAKFLRTPILKSICERLLLLIVIFSQENNRIQRCLDMPEPKLHKKRTFVMLVHSPQTAFHRKMIYNFVWIYLGRSSRPEVFCKKSVLRILQNSQENTCVRVSFLIKIFIQKETLVQMFFCEICEIFKNTFSYRTLPVAASVLANIA